MDFYFGDGNQKLEREFQQLVARENNYSKIANSTDYYIVDIEYATNNARFDMVGINWESAGYKRKQKGLEKYPPKIAFIEMKYYVNALDGNSGIVSHIKDVDDFLGIPGNLTTIKKEMVEIFRQKRKLKLVDDLAHDNHVKELAERPEFILLLANHDPDSIKLQKCLMDIQSVGPMRHADLRIATANFMGYGLYRENIFTLDEFLVRFARQIYSRPAKTKPIAI